MRGQNTPEHNAQAHADLMQLYTFGTFPKDFLARWAQKLLGQVSLTDDQRKDIEHVLHRCTGDGLTPWEKQKGIQR